MRAFRKWRTVRGMARPEAWLLVVAINADRRRWRRVPPVDDGESAVDGRVDDHAGPVTTSIALREALDTLTVRQRTAVVLRYLADLPIAEIADALGCAEGTVRATLHQALTKLRIDLTGADL